jgi:hypothetical protein
MKLLLVVLALFVTACQTMPYEGQAREVVKKPQVEGVVAIPINYRNEDHDKAIGKMTANCQPGEYKITEEGEAIVGQETKSNGKETDRASTEKSYGKLFGIPLSGGEAAGKNTESSQVTTSVKEWQIRYKCLVATTGGKKSKNSL